MTTADGTGSTPRDPGEATAGADPAPHEPASDGAAADGAVADGAVADGAAADGAASDGPAGAGSAGDGAAPPGAANDESAPLVTGADGRLTAAASSTVGPQSDRRGSNLVAAGILVSRLSGLVRTRVFGNYFGASGIADAFNVAFRIPNMMQNLLGEGVLSASFIPVYTRLIDQDRHEEASKVAGAVLGLLAVIAGAVSLFAVVFAAPLATIVAPGFEGPKRDLTVQLMQIVSPGIGLLVLSAWCLGVLNSHRRFFLSYVAPVVWNLVQIAALVIGAMILLPDRWTPIGATDSQLQQLAVALAIGTLVGGLAQLLIQVPSVMRLEPGLRPSLSRSIPGVRQVMRAAGPVIAGRGVVQLATYVDVLLASLLATGAVSLLYYSQQLYLLPVSLFGMSIAAAELPDLSSMDSGDVTSLSHRIDDGLGRVGFWVAGSTVIYLAVGDLLVGALWGTGAFDAQVAQAVWLVLGTFSIGLVATTSSRLLQSLLYGLGDTRSPARISVMRVTVSIVVGTLLMLQLDRFGIVDGSITLLDPGSLPTLRPVPAALRSSEGAGPLRLGAVGLAAGAGVGAWVEWRALRRVVVTRTGMVPRAAGSTRGRLVIPAVVGLATGIAIRQVVAPMPGLVAGVLATAATGMAYVVAALVTRVPEVDVLVDSFGRRLGRPGRILVLWRDTLRRRQGGS